MKKSNKLPLLIVACVLFSSFGMPTNSMAEQQAKPDLPLKLIKFGSTDTFIVYYNYNSLNIEGDGTVTVAELFEYNDTFSKEIARKMSLGRPVKFMVQRTNYDCGSKSYKILGSTYFDKDFSKMDSTGGSVGYEAIRDGSIGETMLQIACKYKTEKTGPRKGSQAQKSSQGKPKQEATKDNVTDKYK